MILPLNNWIKAPFDVSAHGYILCNHGEVGRGPIQGPTSTLGESESWSWKKTLDLNTPKTLS